MNETSDTTVTKSLTMRDFVYVLFRHKWKMLFFFSTVVGLVTVITLISPEIYLSEAKLLLKIGRESVTLDPTASTGPVMHVSQSRRSEINSEIEILRGRDLIGQIIDSVGYDRILMKSSDQGGQASAGWLQTVKSVMKWPRGVLKQLGMSKSLSEREQALITVYNNLYIGSDKESNIIDISFTAKDPQLAQDVVAELITLSLEKHIEAHRTPGSYEFFVEQTELLRNKLRTSEEKLKTLKSQAGITSLEQQQTILLERIRLLELEKDTTASSLASSKAKVQSLEDAITRVPETTVLTETTGYPGTGADAMREELFRLQIEEQKLLKTFPENSRSVESIRKEITRAEELLKKEQDRTQVTKGLNRSYEELQLALLTEKANQVSLQEKLDVLTHQIDAAQQQLVPLNEMEIEIYALKRDIITQEANLRKYSENLEQARIDDAMESQRISNISVVQKATLPVKAIRPKKTLNLALGLFLGVFGAVLLAVVSELMDHTIKSPNDIEEKLHLRNLGYIPRLRSFNLNGKEALSPVNAGSAGLSKKSRSLKSASVLPPAKFYNNYFMIKERLLQSLNGSVTDGYIIGVTSYYRSEGVSTVVANLAKFLGNKYPGKVLVIDANTGYPSLHKKLGVGLKPGLADILKTASAKDAIKQVQAIRMISAGQEGLYLTEDILWQRFTQLMKECKKTYDITLIDVPAVEQGAFVSKIASLCDGVIMVIESERLRWEVAQDCRRQFASGGVKTIGAVLNKRRFYIPKWIYKTI